MERYLGGTPTSAISNSLIFTIVGWVLFLFSFIVMVGTALLELVLELFGRRPVPIEWIPTINLLVVSYKGLLVVSFLIAWICCEKWLRVFSTIWLAVIVVDAIRFILNI